MIKLQNRSATPLCRPSRLHNATINPLLVRLEEFADLSADDQAVLIQLGRREIAVGTHTDLVRAGEAANTAFLVLEGIACLYAQTASGRRQILALLMPGDLCDPDLIYQESWDHGVATLSRCRVAPVPRAVLEDLITTHPLVSAALRRARLEAEARSRKWLAAVGMCLAPERLARLFCEIVDRLHVIGAGERDACSLPLTQVDLAECIGVTTVHISRTLRELRRCGLVDLKDGQLRISNRAGLKALAWL